MLSIESNPIIMAHEPVTADALLDTSAWCDLKYAHGVFMIIEHYRGGDTDVALTVHTGTAASGTTAVAVNFPIWVATSALTDPTLVRQADSTGYTIDTGVYTGSQLVVFYIPAALVYRYVQLGAGAGHADSIISVLYQYDRLRYAGDSAL